MQYVGGKSRISKEISSLINLYSRDARFVSLFCGTCSVESKVISKTKLLNDLHEYLIECLKGAQQGYDFPNEVDKTLYDYVKNNKDEDKILTGFIGFGCSFGGKWFGGYAKNKTGLNYALQSKKSLVNTITPLKFNCIFTNLDYKDVKIQTGDIIYCDPPYQNVFGYSNSNYFDHNIFWDYVRHLSETNLVFVSELTAPEDFVIVGCEKLKRKLDSNKKNLFSSLEKVYVHCSNVERYNFVVIKNVSNIF